MSLMFKCQNNHKLPAQVTSVTLEIETFHDDRKQEKRGWRNEWKLPEGLKKKLFFKETCQIFEVILRFSIFQTGFGNVGRTKQTFKAIMLEVWLYSDVLFDRLIQIKDATLVKIKISSFCSTGVITKQWTVLLSSHTAWLAASWILPSPLLLNSLCQTRMPPSHDHDRAL